MARIGLAAPLMFALAAFAPASALADQPQPAPRTSMSLVGPGFWTNDLDVALRFWTQGLGLVELTRLGLGEVVEVIMGFSTSPNPPMVMLLARKDGAPEEFDHNARDKMVFSVSDGEAVRARLVAAGYEPTGMHVHEASGTRVFFVTDPDGHRLEITQPPTRAPQ